MYMVHLDNAILAMFYSFFIGWFVRSFIYDWKSDKSDRRKEDK